MRGTGDRDGTGHDPCEIQDRIDQLKRDQFVGPPDPKLKQWMVPNLSRRTVVGMAKSTAQDRPESPAVAIVALVVLVALSSSVTRTLASERSAAPQTSPSGSGPFEEVGTLEGAQVDLAEHQGILFTPDGRLFLAWDYRGDRVRLWDVRTLKPVTEPLRHPDLDAFSVAADGRTVFTSGGGEVRLWDVATSKPRATVKADPKDLWFFDATRDGRRFLTVSNGGGTLTVWNATGQQPTKAYDISHGYPLMLAQFDPSGEYLVDKAFAGPFDLLRAETGRAVCPPFEAHPNSSTAPYQAQFDPAGRHLAVPLEGGFRVLECGSGKTVAEAHWDPDVHASQISFSPDGSLVAITTWDWKSVAHGPVYVFDAATAHLVRQLGSADLFRCQLSSGGRFALCNHGRRANPELFDLHDGARVESFPSMQDVNGMALMSPDGEMILVGSKPNTISVWRQRHADPATRP